MRGLLLKSWKNILPTFAYYCFFTAVFFAVSIIAKELIYFGFVCVMFSVAVPVASMARDEQDGWDKFALASGVTRQKFVLSGYLFALLVMLFSWLLFIVLCAVTGATAENFALFLFFGGMSLLSSSVVLVLIHQFGVEKARILLIVAVVAVGVGITSVLFGEDRVSLPLFAMPAVVFAVGWAAFAVSCFVSGRICAKKDY